MKKIVIVDDDRLLSQTLDIYLRGKGHDVKAFHSGVDAVQHLLQEKPDSILLDVKLPDCEGWFVAKLLEKSKWPDKVPFIVMSVLEPDRAKIAETKPYAYIQKPFDMGHLMQTLEGCLSS